jgi:hypothetical protein
MTTRGRTEIGDRRHWRAFWDEIPGWLKAAVIGICGLTAGGAGATGLIGGSGKLDERVSKLEVQVDLLVKQLDKMDSKLDRLLIRRDR